jgi:hypothetical protein
MRGLIVAKAAVVNDNPEAPRAVAADRGWLEEWPAIAALACRRRSVIIVPPMGRRGDRWLVLAGVVLAGCAAPEEDAEAGGCAADEVAVGASCCALGSVMASDGCQGPGVPRGRCGEGFVADGSGGCVAVLPETACGEGTFALPGETTCHEPSPCGEGTWGTIPVDATTQFVDASHGGGDSDGSAARPWTRIADAIAAAPLGGVVAVAEGRYREDVAIGARVALWGRCASRVTIEGTLAGAAALEIVAGGTSVKGVSVTGPSAGISISGAEDVLLEGLRVHDSGYIGLAIEDDFGPTSVTVRSSLIERGEEENVLIDGSSVVIEDSVIRDGRVDATRDWSGWGILVRGSEIDFAPSNLSLRHSLLERHAGSALLVLGSPVAIEDTLIRDTVPMPDGIGGIALEADPENNGAPAALSVVGSVIERSQHIGVLVVGGSLLFDASVVRDTSGATHGWGISVEDWEGGVGQADATILDSLVERSVEGGILTFGATARIERTLVRATAASEARGQGWGIGVSNGHARSDGTLSHVMVTGAVDAGIAINDSHALVSDSLVAEVEPRTGNSTRGDGIGVGTFGVGEPAEARLERVVVGPSARAGVSNFGATVILAGLRSACNPIALNGEREYLGRSLPFAFRDEGGNACGCGADVGACAIETSGLEPYDPLPPSKP